MSASPEVVRTRSDDLPEAKATNFSDAKAEFDRRHATASEAECIVPVNGKFRVSAPIRDAHGIPNEEYYNGKLSVKRR